MIELDINNSCYKKEMIYPGYMLDFPYVLHDTRLYEIKLKGNLLQDAVVIVSKNYEVPIDLFLKSIGTCSIEERIGVLAFGANRNPENMAWKLKRYRDQDNKRIVPTVIVIPAKVKDVDVVAANIFYSGHFFADILFGHEYSKGTEIEAAIQLVDKKQIEAIHKSEEVPSIKDITTDYWGAGIANIPNVFIKMDKELKVNVLTYVSSTSIFISPITNKPIAFKSITANNRKLLAATQEEMYNHLKEHNQISKIVDIMEFKKSLPNFWNKINNGVKDLEKAFIYEQVVKCIKETSLRNYNGEIRTGIAEARKLGLLLSPEETWNIPERFYYKNMF